MWIAASVILLVLAAGVVFFLLPEEQDPSSVLASTEVMVLIHSATEEHVASYNDLFPALRDAPGGTPESTLALVQHGDEVAWILFEPRKNRAESLVHGGALGAPWQIQSSSSNPEALLVKEGTLSSLDTYAQLSSLPPPHTSWAYMDAKRLTENSASGIDGMLNLLAKDSPTIVVWKSGKEWHIGFGASLQIASALPPLSRTPGTFGMALANPIQAIDYAKHLLPPSSSFILEGLARSYAKQWLGSEVSLEHDLAPLLPGAVAMLGEKTSTGSLSIAVVAYLPQTKDHSAALDTLAKRFRATLPQGTVRKFTVDKGFTSTILYPDANASGERTENLQGSAFTVLESKESVRTLVYGMRNQQVMIGSRLSLIKQFVMGEPIEVTPLTIAHGFVPVKLLQQFFGEVLGLSFQSRLLPGLEKLSGTVTWKLTTQNSLPILTIGLE
jgi:hypothetical protein